MDLENSLITTWKDVQVLETQVHYVMNHPPLGILQF